MDMSIECATLARMYEAFNARDIDAALAFMHPAVNWPNAWEGGCLVGHEAIRSYWTRQWAEINSSATPIEFETLADGSIRVLVRVRATNPDGVVVWDNTATHTYAFEGDKVRSMAIGQAV